MKIARFPLARRYLLAAVFALLVPGGCAWIETKQGEWIFNPVQSEWRGFRGLPEGWSEQRIPVGTHGEKIHAWWAPVADPGAPVLLYLHGARWNLTGSITRIPRWNSMGFSVLAIDYRGFGKSIMASGTAPSEQSATDDALAAWQTLMQLTPGRKHFIFGHSLGGAMATQVALKYPDANGLILEGSFTSVPDMIREMRWGFLPVSFLVTQRFDNLDRIDDVAVPVLVVHGTADDVVPFAMGERLFAAARAPKRFLKLEGGNHHNLTANFFSDYRATIAEHFNLPLPLPTPTVAGPNSGSAGAVGSGSR
jgi:alpha-beta hydrolase superfamily lysophospholipase